MNLLPPALLGQHGSGSVSPTLVDIRSSVSLTLVSYSREVGATSILLAKRRRMCYFDENCIS